MVTRVPGCLAMQRAAARGTRGPLRRPLAPRPCARRTWLLAGCVVLDRHSSRCAFRGRSRTVIAFSRCRRTADGRKPRWASTPRSSREQTRLTGSPTQLLALQMVLPPPVPVPVAFAVASHATCLRICTAPAASALPASLLAPRTRDHSPTLARAYRTHTRARATSAQRSGITHTTHRTRTVQSPPGSRAPGSR